MSVSVRHGANPLLEFDEIRLQCVLTTAHIKTGMSKLLAPTLRMLPSTLVRKRRELPLRGRVLVTKGSTVTANTLVAEAYREGELRIVRAAEELGVGPEEVTRCLKVRIGDAVRQGELIAEIHGLWGLLRTRVLSPMDGIIEFVSQATGHVGVRGSKDRIALQAYIDGVVAEVEDSRGVVIEARASFVQGIFGVGGERTGTLEMLDVPLDSSVTKSAIPMDVSGCVLVGGHSPSLEALREAASRGAVGFVTGSIDDTTLKEYVGYDIGVAITGDERISMTLIITEGFGAIPMNSRVDAILRNVDGKRVSINGATQVRAGAVRPEIIGVPTSIELHGRMTNSEDAASEGLTVGSLVRVIRVPYFGQRAVITALPRELERIETGASARVAKVTLEVDGSEVTVPRANLELA